VASRHLAPTNPALARRAIESAREAYDYSANQLEVYRPTVNFPYTDDHPAVAAGRDSMVLAATAEYYIATQDEEFLRLLETMKGSIGEIDFNDLAPRWSRDT